MSNLNRMVGGLVWVAVVALVIFVFPWGKIDWGVVRLGSERTVTVTGQSRGSEANKQARFNAGVTVTDEDKEVATQKVNQGMTELLAAIKALGIPDEDIKTVGISVYETREEGVEMMMYPPRTVSGEVVWRASNSVEIKVDDVDQVQAVADALASSAATEVSGPSYSVDMLSVDDSELLELAMEDAREQAEEIAKLSGARVGKVLTVSEGYSGGPVPFMRSMAVMEDTAVSTPVEPGTSEIGKTVTVTFQLR